MSKEMKIFTTRYSLWAASHISTIGCKPPAALPLPSPAGVFEQLAVVSDSGTNAWVNNPDFASEPLLLHLSSGHGVVCDCVFWRTYEDACRDILKWRLHAVEHAARHLRALIDVKNGAFELVSSHQEMWLDAIDVIPIATEACSAMLTDIKAFIAKKAEEES